jgi:hypothetical protein
MVERYAASRPEGDTGSCPRDKRAIDRAADRRATRHAPILAHGKFWTRCSRRTSSGGTGAAHKARGLKIPWALVGSGRAFAAWRWQRWALGDLQAVEAVYDDNKRTIYLPEDWQGDTPAEVSVLVHELVHHLQNGAGLKFQCPQERERTAFDAQIRWLEIFGKTLEEELGIDAFDTLVRTTCFN